MDEIEKKKAQISDCITQIAAGQQQLVALEEQCVIAKKTIYELQRERDNLCYDLGLPDGAPSLTLLWRHAEHGLPEMPRLLSLDLDRKAYITMTHFDDESELAVVIAPQTEKHQFVAIDAEGMPSHLMNAVAFQLRSLELAQQLFFITKDDIVEGYNQDIPLVSQDRLLTMATLNWDDIVEPPAAKKPLGFISRIRQKLAG